MLKSKQFIALLIAVVLLLINYLLGFLSWRSDTPVHPHYASSAIVYPVLCAFLYIGYYSLKQSADFALSKTLSAGRLRTSKTLQPLVNKLVLRLRTHSIIMNLSLACVAAAGICWLNLRAHSLVLDYQAIALSIQTIPLWFLSLLILRLVWITYFAVKKHLLQHQRLQLFEVNRLNALSNFGVGVVVVYCGALTIYAFNSIFIDFDIWDIVTLLSVFMLVISLMLAPGYVIVNKLRQEKEHELSLINERIASKMQAAGTHPKRQRLVDNNDTLYYISDLLTVRKTIQAIPIIPISMPAFSKIVVLLMLPILSWFAAGMVSHLFDIVAQ